MVQREFSVPDNIEPGAVLVRTRTATVCGSDMHTFRGRRHYPTPCILGHEGIGTIDQLGSGVDTDAAGNTLAAGNRITWTIMACCGMCYFCMQKQLPQKCLKLFKYGHSRSDAWPYFTGTFAEYVYIKPGTGVFRVPRDMTDEEASPLMCAASTVAGGIERVGIQAGDTVLVQGAGMLGLYAVSMAKERGAGQVIVTDVIEDRLTLASQFGADHVFNAKTAGAAGAEEIVRDLTRGWGADVAIEVTGSPEVIESGVKMLRTGGRYLLEGSIYPGDKINLDAGDLITRCITIVGVHNYEPRHLGLALAFVNKNRNKYPFGKLVGPKFPLTADGVTSAMEALERREAIRPAITGF